MMLVALYSPKGTYNSLFLANYANINLNDELTRVPGVASVFVFGIVVSIRNQDAHSVHC